MDASDRLWVAVLGPLEVTAGALRVDLGPPKQRALFALLAMQAPHVVVVDELVAGLWGEVAPRSAFKTLQTYVARLRRVLPAGCVVTAGGGYRLAVDAQGVDAGRFEELLGAARRSQAAGDAVGAVDRLTVALGLWRGAALGDVVGQPKGVAAAHRLEELRRVAIEDLHELRLGAGAHHELIADLQAAVCAEPLRERRWAQLITALYRSGRQAEALGAYRRLRDLLDEELGIEPSARLVQLERDVLLQRDALQWDPPPVAVSPDVVAAGVVAPSLSVVSATPESAVSPPRRARVLNMPTTFTPFVGRDDELEAVTRLVSSSGVRLVTLTGPGGSGKTRLGVEVAERLVGVFADGVFFVALANVATADVMWTSISGALDAPAEARTPPEFFAYAADLSAVVILDNLEQLPAADSVIAQLLSEAPQLVVLATSRRSLHLRGEHEFPVPPLALPAQSSVGAVGGSGAGLLFVQHAQMVRRGFALTPDNVADVASLCRRLDGLPLALELAAARVKLLSPKALLGHLDRALDISVSGPDRPPRQQTLRTTITWSYDLLTDVQRSFFRRLGVFAGGADLAAVEAVTGDLLADVDALQLIADLADASLITIGEAADGEPRIQLLETIRGYALQELRATAELDTVAARHAEHYLTVAQQWEPRRGGEQFIEARTHFETELDNFREALRWALPDDAASQVSRRVGLGLRLCSALATAWSASGYFAEAQEWTRRAIARSDGADRPELATCILLLASSLIISGDMDRARDLAAQSIAMWRRLGDPHRLAMALAELARTESENGRSEEARAGYEEALGLPLDGAGRRTLLMDLAIVEAIDENYERSLELNAEALALAEQLGHPVSVLIIEQNVACTLRLMDKVDAAARQMHELIPRALRMHGPENLVALAEDYAAVLADLGVHALAARLFGAATAMRQRLGTPASPTQLEEIAEPIAKIRAGLSDQEWADAYHSGLAVTVEDALAQAHTARIPAAASGLE